MLSMKGAVGAVMGYKGCAKTEQLTLAAAAPAGGVGSACVLFLLHRLGGVVHATQVREKLGGVSSSNAATKNSSALLILTLPLVLFFQLPNAVLLFVSPTIFVGGAVVVVLLTTFLGSTNYRFLETGLIGACFCGDLVYDGPYMGIILEDVFFYLGTIFFIVLRPVLNLGLANLMSAVTSAAILVAFAPVVAAKGLFGYFGCLVAVFSVLIIKTVTVF